jgi:DNA-binding CsgD family transcriptional regulator|tara:strand:+ start:1497 stop:1649 length:153 start_codon:yes stop_codon:yes gene_type:complete
MSGVYMAELEYDIQEMFIEGCEPDEIAHKLGVSVGKIVAVLNEFGVRYSE